MSARVFIRSLLAWGQVVFLLLLPVWVFVVFQVGSPWEIEEPAANVDFILGDPNLGGFHTADLTVQPSLAEGMKAIAARRKADRAAWRTPGLKTDGVEPLSPLLTWEISFFRYKVQTGRFYGWEW
jgi:hypothetical protein